MTSDFDFLKPWHADLQTMLTTREPEAVLQTSFSLPVRYYLMRDLYVELPVDERSRSQLQHVSEAIELFTALSFVNNRAFVEFFPRIDHNPRDKFSYAYPNWFLRLSGTLPSNDIAAIQFPVTWSTLFGFLDDLSGYSSEFQVAMQKLEVLEMEEIAKKDPDDTFVVDWECISPDSQVCGELILDGPTNTLGSLLAGFRALFNLNVPPAVQLYAIDNKTDLTTLWQQQELRCGAMMVHIMRDAEIQQLVAALSKTTSYDLVLIFENIARSTTQVKRNVGALLNSLLCNSSISQVPITRQGNYGEIKLSCVTDSVFAATCSAVAELSSDTNLSHFDVLYVLRERWSWLMYALCCGSPERTLPSVEIQQSTLTKANLLAIEAVLKPNYPLPVQENGLVNFSQYGFVDIREGAELHMGEISGSNGKLLVTSRSCRCRALYNPSSTSYNDVEMIVPGYGICTGKLGDDIQFIPDCGTANLGQKRLSGSLTLKYVEVESAAVLMDLLTLITCGLRVLNLSFRNNDNNFQVDLTVLAAACPDLQELGVGYSKVVNSAHDEAFRSWTIHTMSVYDNNCLAELSTCLKDPSVRMARELVKLTVWRLSSRSGNEEEVKTLKAHDGEFLPVVKEKLPLQAKVAMISTVISSEIELKAIHLLDAHLLSLVFTFASTPAQREVKVHD